MGVLTLNALLNTLKIPVNGYHRSSYNLTESEIADAVKIGH